MSDQSDKSRAICILGMHRSGTSAIARAVNLLGVYLGKESDLIPALDYNPEGFWERIDFNDLQERLLAEMKRKWDTAVPFPDGWQGASEVKPFRDEISSLVRANFSGVPLWGWKDPRSAIFIELWKEILIDIGVDLAAVFVVRNPLDVARSLQKRDGFSLDKGFGIWFNYNITSLRATDNIPKVFISYDRFLDDWEVELRRVSEGLAIAWPRDDGALREKMTSFVRVDLRHSASTVEDLKKSGAPLPVIELHKLFQRLLAGESPESRPNRKTVAQLYNSFFSYAQFYHHDMTELWKYRESLDLLERQLNEKDRKLLEKEQQLAEKAHELTKKDHKMAEKDRQLLEKEQQLTGKDMELTEKERQIAEINRQLVQLTEKDRQLLEKEQRSIGENLKLTEKEQQIAEINRQLIQLSEMDRRLAEMERQLVDKDRRLAERGKRLAEKDQRVRNLINSLSWKITSPLRDVHRILKRQGK